MPGIPVRISPFNGRLADVLCLERSFIYMDFRIRRATKEDCAAMLDLVRELATFERAPDEVTVSLQHFEESGFGEKPVWWAYVACAPEQAAMAESAGSESAASLITPEVQDPLLAQILEDAGEPVTKERDPEVLNALTLPSADPIVQLPDALTASVPEELSSVLPQPAAPCARIIGLALYYIRFSTWKGQRMFLEDIVVTEDWRGKGVGTALMDALFGEAKASGLHGISWQVLNWNQSAITFYQRYGVRFDKEWVNVAVDL